MSGDNSEAEAALAVLNGWYSRRVGEKYTGEVAKHVLMSMTPEAKGLSPDEKGSLKSDFAMTFPLRGFPPTPNYFSRHYSRFEGYIGNSILGGGDVETRALETMASVFDVRKRMMALIGKLVGAAGESPPESLDEIDIDMAFGETFQSAEDFAGFCLGYLRTRMLNANIRSSWGVMPVWEYERRAKNFKRVEAAVSFFAENVVGDLLH